MSAPGRASCLDHLWSAWSGVRGGCLAIRFARTRPAEPEQWHGLLVLIEAAVALQPDTAAVIRDCLDSGGQAGSDLARQVTRLTSSYAFLISRVDELSSSLAVEEATRLLRYHHMLLAETARNTHSDPLAVTQVRTQYLAGRQEGLGSGWLTAAPIRS
jgi:hypothetical protein